MPPLPAEPAHEDRTPFSPAAVAAAVLVVLLGLGVIGWGAVAAVASAQHNDPGAEQLVRAEPATYRPVPANQSPTYVAPPMGDWTAAKGRVIAERALAWLNWPYTFGGGGPNGPSYGVAVDADSHNDPHVYGFDCSGLAMYALAPYLRNLAHDAAKQYSEVGHWHPALNSLQVGDLIFWSKDGTINGIGHVAVYIGNGQVVQAPRSGDVIRITPIYEVESGDMGATRPLT